MQKPPCVQTSCSLGIRILFCVRTHLEEGQVRGDFLTPASMVEEPEHGRLHNRRAYNISTRYMPTSLRRPSAEGRDEDSLANQGHCEKEGGVRGKR